jgi:hypothetical protein
MLPMRVESQISSSTKARRASKSDAQGLVRRLPATAVRRQSGAHSKAVQFTRGALVLLLKKVLRWVSADPIKRVYLREPGIVYDPD